MANNTNQQAINFANQKARPYADTMITAYFTAKTLVATWNGQNIVSVLPNDANLIQDGATVASGTPDGRAPITDGQVNIEIANAIAFIAWMEANSNLLLNQFMQVSVNGKSVI